MLVEAVESLRLKIARLTLEQSLHCEEFITMGDWLRRHRAPRLDLGLTSPRVCRVAKIGGQNPLPSRNTAATILP
jgi:hypothetical protein